MKKKLTVVMLGVFILECFHIADAQTAKIPRVGYVSVLGGPATPDRSFEALQQGLRDLGYVEGKNIAFEFRGAEGKWDRIPGLVVDLVQLKVDLLFCPNFPAIEAAKQATKTIPIVMMSNVDPVELGIVDSLARPGGNITGMTLQSLELSGKRLELLKEIFPKLKRVALVWNLGDQGMNLITKQIEAVAPPLGVKLQPFGVREPNDFGGIFDKISQNPPEAIFSIADRLILAQQRQILDFGVKSKIPTMFDFAPAVEAGALMAYGPDRAEVSRRAAVYVDKILKGAKPADLPVEQPTKFELVINLKTAKQIGLTIPPNVLARADKVIK
ncbi:MAG TPA: ABC transporter substrate-binding protein [Candidatus Binatia bacterium]|jgi:putative ABC transport system substrate-binding protein|nr:ABC transporter substrate-binding protein [Candidatus Binatia bacterium]